MKAEVDFPRGAAATPSKPAPSSKREPSFLRSLAAPSRKEKRKRRDADDVSSTRKRTEGDDYGVSIVSLRKEMLSEGMLLLGCVESIQDYQIAVSLPGKLKGFIPINKVSNPYTDVLRRFAAEEEGIEPTPLNQLFRVGMLVRCAISRLGDLSTENNAVKKKKKSKIRFEIELTTNPVDVHRGILPSNLQNGTIVGAAVKSVEEHGYVMDIGIPGVEAFLKSAFAEGYVQKMNEGNQLYIGQIVPCIVDTPNLDSKKQKLRSVILNADPKTVSKVVLEETSHAPLLLLLPGTMLKCSISDVQKDGLVVKFQTFTGTVCKEHAVAMRQKKKRFKKKAATDDSSVTVKSLSMSNHKVDSVVQASVLFINPLTKTICLSLLPHLKLTNTFDPLPGIKKGDLYDAGTVIDSSRKGVYVSFPEGLIGFSAVAKIVGNRSENCSDDKIQKTVISQFPVGKTVQCRAIAKHLIDGIISVRISEFEDNAVTYETLTVGEYVTGTIVEISSNVAKVEIAPSVYGIIPKRHSADFPLSDVSKGFKHSQKVKCRILEIDPVRNRCILTHKASLLSSKLPIVGFYDTGIIGTVTEGVVNKIMEGKGIILEFFSRVRGMIPYSNIITYLGDASVPNLSTIYHDGQVVKCTITGCDVEMQRLRCSLYGSGKKRRKSETLPFIGHAFQNSKVILSENGSLMLALSPDLQQVMLPMSLGSDFRYLRQPMHQLHCATVKLETVVGLPSTGTPVVTTRNSFIQWATSEDNQRPTKIEDLFPGAVFPAVVKAIEASFVVVNLPVTGVANAVIPLASLADGGLRTCYGAKLNPLQTVFVQVLEVDITERKVLLSASSDLIPSWLAESCAGNSFVAYGSAVLTDYLQSVARLQKLAKKLPGSTRQLASYSIGDIITIRVTEVGKFVKAVTVDTETGIAVELSGQHNFSLRETGKVVVLFVDFWMNSLLCNGDPEFVSAYESRKAPAKIGKSYSCFFVGIFKDFLLTCIASGTCRGQLICVPTRRHWNDSRFMDYTEKPNRSYSIQVATTVNGLALGVVQSSKPTKRKLKRPYAEEQTEIPKRSENSKRKRLSDSISSETSIMSETKEIKEEPIDEKLWLGVSGGFLWDPKELEQALGKTDPIDSDDESTSSEDEAMEKLNVVTKPAPKKSRSEILADDFKEEERIHKIEKRLNNPDHRPETPEDFERLVLGEPNNSSHWVQYMAFYLPLQEVDKARNVAERALKTISFREETEKLNVWVALLNLENMCGTPELLQTTLQRALKSNDQLSVYKALVKIYVASDKIESAEQILNTMVKKFRQERSIWIQFFTFYFEHQKLESARQLLDRALKSLGKEHHIDIISKFAQLEFKLGSAERGGTLFETMLANYPKRCDIWSIYIDMVVKKGDFAAARKLMERITQMTTIPVKKMKFFFKKWLNLEKEHGTTEMEEYIKQKVLKYAEGSTV